LMREKSRITCWCNSDDKGDEPKQSKETLPMHGINAVGVRERTISSMEIEPLWEKSKASKINPSLASIAFFSAAPSEMAIIAVRNDRALILHAKIDMEPRED